MRASARLHHPRVDRVEETPTHLVVTVEGDDNEGSLRPRLVIIPVVDRSGSMGEERKLAIVTSALGHLANHLVDDDLVGLVSFDNVVLTHLPPSPATEAGMARFRSTLAELRPGGSTNLSGGLDAGLAEASCAARGAEAGTVIRVLVLTDGRANVGATSANALMARVSDLPEGVSVSFLGVGTNCDHDLLGRLAEAGGGSYGFIETADRAADALGAEIGGLLHTAASSVSIAVTARPKYARIDDPLASRFEREGERVTVRLGTLAAGVKRHVVVPLVALGPGRAHARPVTVAEVEVCGVVDDARVSLTLLPKAHFAEVDGREEDLDEIVELAVLADAQARAEEAARAGRFGDSVALLNSMQATTASAKVLQEWMAGNYADAGSYTASAVERRSSLAALSSTSAGLVGSSSGFDVMASRTIGTYMSAAQRQVANETHVAVSQGLGLSGRGAPPVASSRVGSGGGAKGPESWSAAPPSVSTTEGRWCGTFAKALEVSNPAGGTLGAKARDAADDAQDEEVA